MFSITHSRYIAYAIQCSMKMCNLHLSRYDEDEGEGVDEDEGEGVGDDEDEGQGVDDDEDEGVDDGEDEADEQ